MPSSIPAQAQVAPPPDPQTPTTPNTRPPKFPDFSPAPPVPAKHPAFPSDRMSPNPPSPASAPARPVGGPPFAKLQRPRPYATPVITGSLPPAPRKTDPSAIFLPPLPPPPASSVPSTTP